VTLTTYSGN